MDDFENSLTHSHSGSSSDLEKLVNCMTEVRSFAESRSAKSTLLESLENKIKKLLHYREESITLRSKLKLSDESQKILIAEFAFQKKQYEQEIQQLKNIVKELREALLKEAPTAEPMDDDKKKITESNNEKITNKDLTDKILELEQQNNNYKDKIKELDEQNKNLIIKVQQLEQQNQILKNKIHELVNQNKEYNNKINELKQSKNNDNKAQTLESQMQSLNNKIHELKQQNKKLKTRIQELENQSNESNQKMRKLEDQNHNYNNKIQKLKHQNDSYINKINEFQQKDKDHNNKMQILESQNNDNINIINELKQQNQKLNNKMQILESQNDDNINIINELKQQNQKLNNKIQELEHQNKVFNNAIQQNESKDDNSKLIHHLQNKINRRNIAINILRKENHSISLELQKRINASKRIREIITEQTQQHKTHVQQIESILHHYESEFQVLEDILHVEDDPLHEWVNIRKKAREAFDAITLAEENKILLSSAKKEIDELQQKIQTFPEKLDKTNEYSQLLMEFESYKKENEIIQRFTQQNRLRNLFSRKIAQCYKEAIDFINELYESIIGKKEQSLRTVVLTVIFTCRWNKIKNLKNQIFDENSLHNLTIPTKYSFDFKLKEISNTFLELTNELINVKREIQKKNEEFNNLKLYYEERTENIENAQKIIDKYKERIQCIAEENSKLIHPSKLEKIISKLNEIENENQKLNIKINELNCEIEKKKDEISVSNNEIMKYKVKQNEVLEEMKAIKNELNSKKDEIDVLKTKLCERNKEILALERIVNLSSCRVVNADYKQKENSIEIYRINQSFLP